MKQRSAGSGRGRTLERRLFVWLFAVALVPASIVLALAAWVGVGSLGWLGSLGPWELVGGTGRELFDAAAAADADPALAAAVERHRSALATSLMHAQRWNYLGGRVAGAAPWVLAFAVLLLALVAAAVARRLARSLVQPVAELVDWSDRLGRDAPLPAPGPAEASDPAEVAALRAALRRASERLAAERQRALEAARLRAWGELARRVAHEMKNPLTPLRLAAHRLRGVTGTLPAAAEPLDVIEAELLQLDELAREFAALGQPSGGRASEVDLGELCARLLASDVPPRIRTRLHAAESVSIIGHHEILRRAVRNLLRNAVEAIDAGGREDGAVEVEVSLAAGVAELRITDNGTGLPALPAGQIFEPDVTMKRGGTGLGLALVRQAAATHGGTVAAANRAGGGAEFVLSLPQHGVTVAVPVADPIEGVS